LVEKKDVKPEEETKFEKEFVDIDDEDDQQENPYHDPKPKDEEVVQT
jgi:hypothetical protein